MSVTQEDQIDKGSEEAGSEKKPDKPEKKVIVTVDERDVPTPKDTTPRALLVAAGLDPTQRQLVRVKGKHQEPFTDLDQEINVHEGEQFITVSTGGTPVS